MIQAGHLDPDHREAKLEEIQAHLDRIGMEIVQEMDDNGLDAMIFPTGLDFGSMATAVASTGGFPMVCLNASKQSEELG